MKMKEGQHFGFPSYNSVMGKIVDVLLALVFGKPEAMASY